MLAARMMVEGELELSRFLAPEVIVDYRDVKFEGKTILLNGLKNKKFYHAREGQIAKILPLIPLRRIKSNFTS